MCIRDRPCGVRVGPGGGRAARAGARGRALARACGPPRAHARGPRLVGRAVGATEFRGCLLYTSDAADERSSVDLGGRRIIKKKKQHKK